MASSADTVRTAIPEGLCHACMCSQWRIGEEGPIPPNLRAIRIARARTPFRAGLMVNAKRASKNQLTLPKAVVERRR